MATVYFFDDRQQLITFKTDDELTMCLQEKEITEDKQDLIKNTLKVIALYDERIVESSFMAVEEEKDSFSLYRILTSDDPENKLDFIGSDFAFNELDGYIIKEIRPQNEPMGSVAKRLLEGTEWKIGHVDSGLGTVSGSFYYTSVKEALKSLQTYGCEIEFRCSLNSNGVEDKWINIYKQIGERTNKRFTYGDTALEVVKKIDRSQLFTSLIGRGKGEEVGETAQGDATYGRRIEFADIVWSKANGDPLDKPKGQIFLEDEELTQLYGIPQKDGSMRKRESVVIFEDEESPAGVLKKTYQQLKLLSRPLIQFRSKVLDGEKIGNTVEIHNYEKGYHYEARVFKTTLDMITGRLECGLGDNLTSNVAKQTAKQINSIQRLDEEKTSYYDSNKIAMYQTDMIRGAGKTGGSIFQMSPFDTGDGDSRVPFQTVYMDGPSIDKSKNFLVLNSQGLGFLEGDFWTAKYRNAWTIDGRLNADFIQTGTLNGVRIQAEDEKFLIDMFNGKIDFSDVKTRKKLGMLGATTGATGLVNGFAIIQENDSIFSINSRRQNSNLSRAVFQVPKESTGENRLWNLFGKGVIEGDVDIKNRLDVKELYVDGVKIDTNGGGTGGGGHWNGIYPPEITSDRDKRYWQIWAMSITSGMTQEAAAALCGNAQGESDANPRADEGNGAPGFGYGVYQWTDSTGRNSGRLYMINLMTLASIVEDPDTILAQQKLLMWHAPNGQWVATNAYPYTWSQFMNMTDINTATQAFVANFERPRDPHPERSVWAQEWYDRFSKIKIPEATGYIAPMSNYVVTSEFGWRTLNGVYEFHNAIDLAAPNNQPIFASASGEVVFASGDWWAWYGNYVVIKHDDGLYTGYAHLNVIDVRVGQRVNQGDKIGLEGSTGPSTGPHLHFQFMKRFPVNSNDDFINPRNKVKL
ncbi:phage tail spike protein [Vagococcus fluvialis]|uniref:phage tail spike protein n=1 Tax=Vagococcus fluvialis TaxID=2738 RepID=UPI0037D38432